MRVVRIPKRKGEFRTIYVPDDDEMRALRALLPELTKIMIESDKAGVMHAFFPHRSPLTNAMQHCGFQYTVNFDLKDFFDTVKPSMMPSSVMRLSSDGTMWVREKIAKPELPELQVGQWIYYRKCNGRFEQGRVKSKHPEQDAYFVVYHCDMDWENFADYTAALTNSEDLWLTNEQPPAPRCHAGQGLPTSPMLANIAAADLDQAMLALRGRSGRFDTDFVYTRYADDMTFSFDDPRLVHVLRQRVPEIVERHGFKLNDRKTEVQSAKVGRRRITGYAVDDQVHPTRATLKRLRAARHRGRPSQAAGLEEWCRMRLPRGYQPPAASPLSNAVQPIKARHAASSAPEPSVSRQETAQIQVRRRRFDL